MDPAKLFWAWLDHLHAEFAGGLDADVVEAATAEVMPSAKPTSGDPFPEVEGPSA